MANFGFVIDQRKCIGCHACTVACKMENDIPLGVFNTWVKYIEKGEFPDTRRYFSVLRCNHCEDAPCVNICPTRSLFTRADGIVDFDHERCIGCKACMQACPYDALYIDPATLTAKKCNFCAHRVEVDLAPACEIVCPTHAIISGDMEDPGTEIYQILRREQVSVRSPEQGTSPNVFYIGADEAAINPEATVQADAYLWSEIVPDAQTSAREERRSGGVHDLVREATTTYNVAHPPMWKRKVSTYLWTKSFGAGAALVAIFALIAGHPAEGAIAWPAPVLAFAGVALTGYLLIADLKQPQRFLYIFLKPNWTSWLVWGAWILVAFSGALVGWTWAGLGGPPVVGTLGKLAVIPLAPMAAAYSGWLFNQAEGRDLWQSKLLHVHLVVLAVVCGAASLLLLSAITGASADLRWFLAFTLAMSAFAHGGILLLEYTGSHTTENAATATRSLVAGAQAPAFWTGATLAVPVAVGAVALFGLTGTDGFAYVAAASALAGTWLYEEAWVLAGQAAPLS